MFRKILILITIINCIYLIPNNTMAKPPIVIGMSAAMTGPSSALGQQLHKGAQAYFKWINDQGGVYQQPLKLILYDDAYNPNIAVKNTVTLIEKDNVDLLFGYVGTPTVTRMLPLLKRYQHKHIYLYFPFTGAQPQREFPYNQFVFNYRASYREETAGLVDQFYAAGYRRFAIFYQSDAYGRSGWDGVRKQLQTYGLIPVQETSYYRGAHTDDDFSDQAMLIQTSTADVVISIASYQASAGLVRDLRAQNWDGPIANISFVGSKTLLQTLQNIDGKDLTQNLINSEVVPDYQSNTPAAIEYRTRFSQYFPNTSFDSVSFEGFLNAKLLVTILKQSKGNFRKKDLPNYTYALTQFSPAEHQASHQIYYVTAQEGRFVPINTWRKAE